MGRSPWSGLLSPEGYGPRETRSSRGLDESLLFSEQSFYHAGPPNLTGPSPATSRSAWPLASASTVRRTSP
jgi:hypothetical protein